METKLKVYKPKKSTQRNPLDEMVERIAKNASIREDVLYMHNVGKFLIKLSKRILEQ